MLTSAPSSFSPVLPAAPAPAPVATEEVVRPDPGVARGKWEASPLAIVVIASALLLAFLVFLALKVRRARKTKKGTT